MTAIQQIAVEVDRFNTWIVWAEGKMKHEERLHSMRRMSLLP
jgi:hypothetical protein